MAWITLDESECTLCGLCETICPRGCIKKEEDQFPVWTNQENCFLCGHCISICPAHALSCQAVDMDNFLAVSEQDVEPDKFMHLLRAKRSNRHFKDKNIPRADLERLVEVCRYCATGSNAQKLEIMFLTDKAAMSELAGLSVDFFAQFMKKVQSELRDVPESGAELTPEQVYLQQRMGKARRIVENWEAGQDTILYKAPAAMIFHSHPICPTPLEDCVLAAQTVTLYAHTLGIESCFVGFLKRTFWEHEPVREKFYSLGLPRENKIYCVLIMGYPKYKFLRTVDRKQPKVIWR